MSPTVPRWESDTQEDVPNSLKSYTSTVGPGESEAQALESTITAGDSQGYEVHCRHEVTPVGSSGNPTGPMLKYDYQFPDDFVNMM